MALDPHKGKLIEKVKLPNGLTLELLDYSKRVAGDRWFVGLLARIPIEVDKDYLESISTQGVTYEEFIEACGKIIYFELKKERNFIDEKEKDEILNALSKRLKEHVIKYMGHPNFAKLTLKKRLKEYEERRNWWKE